MARVNNVCKNLTAKFLQVNKSDCKTAMAMTDIEVEKKVEYGVDRKTEAERGMEDAADKVKAEAKAVENKIRDPDRDLDTEYTVEKVKEKLD